MKEHIQGVTPSGPGCQPSASATSADATASSRSGIPNAVLNELHSALEEEFNRAAGTEGWRLIDTPKLPPAMMDELIERCGGGEHVRTMVGSSGNFRIVGKKSEPCEPWVRASLLISPEGCRLARESTASGIEGEAEDPQGLHPEGESPVGESRDAQ